MKHKFVLFSLLFLLVGCNVLPSEELSTSTVPTSSESSEQSSATASEISSAVSSEITSILPSEPVSEGERTGKRNLHFFGLNDFHGAVTESGSDPGIFRISSYIKHLENIYDGNVIKLNAGDYWQGSADSNLNNGQFLNDVLTALDFDAFTLGNHEFDWFDTTIEQNRGLTHVPYLGANIMRKATDAVATNLVSYDDTFKGSIIVNKNDVNIGIIGVMGEGLESSILATAIAPYYFASVDTYVRSEAANLRALGADMIVLSTHDSLAEYPGYTNLGNYTGIINEKIVDIVFSGHFHLQHNAVENGIPILQTNGYGRQVMEVSGAYNFDTKEFEVTDSGLTFASTLKTYAEDVSILNLFEPYRTAAEPIKNEVVGTLTATMSTTQLANLANRVMYDLVKDDYLANEIVAVHNSGGVRKAIARGQVTYGAIYESFPFDNEIRVIENMSGSDLRAFITGNPSYSPHPSYPLKIANIDEAKTYTLVTIDYLSTDSWYTQNKPQIVTGAYVRDLIAHYFRETGTVNPSDFS